MSGHRPRPGPQPRHPARPALRAAAAAIILLALAACTSTTTTSTTTPASPLATVSAGPGGNALILTGAGSTFDAPFFTAAFAAYEHQHPTVAISYSAVGSSAGIAAFSARQADFGASDVPMTATEQAAARGGPVTQVPVDLGGEGGTQRLWSWRRRALYDRGLPSAGLGRRKYPQESEIGKRRDIPHRGQ
jgi:phosphate transport system substrate-binding protein